MPGTVQVEEVIEGLRNSVPRGPSVVADQMEGIAIRPSSLQPYLFFKPQGYTRNLIYRDEQFELLALCWQAGACSPVHDHAGEECFFLVQQGAFRVDNYALKEGGLQPGFARLEHEGTVLSLTARMVDHRTSSSDIHRVSVMPATGRAVSIHCYARPIERSLVFDLTRNHCAWSPDRYHSMFGQWIPDSHSRREAWHREESHPTHPMDGH